MERLKDFQNVAHKNGFTDAGETDDGTVMWLRKPTAKAEDRICIDSETNSATVFTAEIPGKTISKTFRAASALQDWFVLTAAKPTPAETPVKSGDK
jgi:hypothetical protein